MTTSTRTLDDVMAMRRRIRQRALVGRRLASTTASLRAAAQAMDRLGAAARQHKTIETRKP